MSSSLTHPRIAQPDSCTAFLNDLAFFMVDIDIEDASVVWQYVHTRTDGIREIIDLAESEDFVGTRTRTLKVRASAERNGLQVCAKFKWRDHSVSHPSEYQEVTDLAVLTVTDRIQVTHPAHASIYEDDRGFATFHAGINVRDCTVQWHRNRNDGGGWRSMSEVVGSQVGTRTRTVRVGQGAVGHCCEYKAVFSLPDGRTVETEPAGIILLPADASRPPDQHLEEVTAMPYGRAIFTVANTYLRFGDRIEWEYQPAGETELWTKVVADECHMGVDTHRLVVCGGATRPESHLDRYRAVILRNTLTRALDRDPTVPFWLWVKRMIPEQYMDVSLGATDFTSHEHVESTVRLHAGMAVRLNAHERRTLNALDNAIAHFSFDGSNWHFFDESASGIVWLDDFQYDEGGITGRGSTYTITGIIRPPKTMWLKISGAFRQTTTAYILKMEVLGTTAGDKIVVFGSPPGDPEKMISTIMNVRVSAGQSIVVSGGATAGTSMRSYEYSFTEGADWYPFQQSASGYLNVGPARVEVSDNKYTPIKGEIIPPGNMWVRVSSEYNNNGVRNHTHVMKILVDQPITDITVDPVMTPASLTVSKNTGVAYIRSEGWGPDTMEIKWQCQVASDSSGHWHDLDDGAGPSPNPVLARLRFSGTASKDLWISGISPDTIDLVFRAAYRDPVLNAVRNSTACTLVVSMTSVHLVPSITSFPIQGGAPNTVANIVERGHLELRNEFFSGARPGSMGTGVEIGHRMRREGVIGTEGRIQIKNTKTFPYRCIGLLSAYVMNDEGVKLMKTATGWLVAPDLIVTAAHVVFDLTYKRWSFDITFYAGADGTVEPSTRSQMKQVWLDQTFVDEGKAGRSTQIYDWAILRLQDPIGQQTGWMGVEWSPEVDAFAGARASMAGYPGVVENANVTGTLWLSEEQVLTSAPDQFRVDIDGTKGQSGAPVYLADDYTAIGLFTGSFQGVEFNWTRRITHQIYSLIRNLAGG
ncbi:trypsin-like serine protease [Xylophilus rhododendri]|uniref:Serine protease n=1 Tax=Xylophilus rhododendri TaxID=2697032 RepID=A0A857IYQ5_9BURK|nr:trypsin-like peptidase domain-containing protein [Xylophilus rhododendri]QHI96700.1 trypsin-like serine protease [Xylophilus rhododendri]